MVLRICYSVKQQNKNISVLGTSSMKVPKQCLSTRTFHSAMNVV